MAIRLLRFLTAVGIFMLAFGVGQLVDGNVLPGVGLTVAGVLLGIVPMVLLVRALHGSGSGRPFASPAMAVPALRRGARVLAGTLFAWSLLPFLAAGALVLVFYRIPSRDGGSTGQIVTMVVLGCALAMVPATLGFGFLRCGSLLLRGDTEGAEGALRLNWILLAIGGITAIAAFSDDRPGYGTVALVAAVVAGAALVVNVLLGFFLLRVVGAEQANRPSTVHEVA
ncbi:hypothetical protein [Micromonospora mirobrigensis]|uniref:Uncharacterized protein n=1 Tax=Micromonospora mirobrigensis TaxID=262898 RepID=A0A1C4UJS1_9ACTN|nr:hypothetical protein [Micromonospora mirobrigensis]SCE71933.1 hypothetical protein GA0070564_101531 [Micromonospora mirobrigensis]